MQIDSCCNNTMARHVTTTNQNNLSQNTPPCPSSPSPSLESTWSPHNPNFSHHCVASFRSHKGNITSIALTKSGLVLTGSDSTRIRAWRQSDFVDIGYIKASSSKVQSMLVQGDMLFTSHKDHKIRVWKLGSQVNSKYNPRKITTLPKSSYYNLPFFSRVNPHQHKDVISCMGYDYNEEILYTGSLDKSIKAWKIGEQTCIDSFVAHRDNINALVVNQEDGCIFSASNDGTTKIWRRTFGGCSHLLTMTLKFNLSPINALALSVLPSGRVLYSGCSDGCTNFWVKERNSCRYNHGGFLKGHLLAVECLMVVKNLVISGSEDATIRVWRREEGSVYHECIAVLEGHEGPVKCVNACLEMDNNINQSLMFKALNIYSASLDKDFRAWRVEVSPETMSNSCINHGGYYGDGYDDDDGGTSDDGGGGWNSRSMEFEMSPVLSPIWVEKKLQVGNISYN